MASKALIIAIIVLLSACTSSIPIVRTNNPEEYVIVGRNMAGPLSSLKLAQDEAELRAKEHCEAMSKIYKKGYSIDRPLALSQFPESILYFTCI